MASILGRRIFNFLGLEGALLLPKFPIMHWCQEKEEELGFIKSILKK